MSLLRTFGSIALLALACVPAGDGTVTPNTRSEAATHADPSSEPVMVPTADTDESCVSATQCGAAAYCSMPPDAGRGSCVPLPQDCGAPADCADPACGVALAADCSSGASEACSNPIDGTASVIGNPLVQCAAALNGA
jgi:hypothetical protein